NRLKLLNTEQYLDMRREAFANDGISEYPFDAYDVNGTWDQNRYTDWQKKLMGGQANLKQLQASISGGIKNTLFYLSGSYQNETTVFPDGFNYDRITTNSNISHKSSNDKFEVRSEEHTSELQSRENLVCRLLLEKKKHKNIDGSTI